MFKKKLNYSPVPGTFVLFSRIRVGFKMDQTHQCCGVASLTLVRHICRRLWESVFANEAFCQCHFYRLSMPPWYSYRARQHWKHYPLAFTFKGTVTKKLFFIMYSRKVQKKNTMQIRSSKRGAKRSTWLFGYRLEGYLVASSVYVGRRLHCGSV